MARLPANGAAPWGLDATLTGRALASASAVHSDAMAASATEACPCAAHRACHPSGAASATTQRACHPSVCLKLTRRTPSSLRYPRVTTRASPCSHAVRCPWINPGPCRVPRKRILKCRTARFTRRLPQKPSPPPHHSLSGANPTPPPTSKEFPLGKRQQQPAKWMVALTPAACPHARPGAPNRAPPLSVTLTARQAARQN